jgi:Mg2+ and Co2+ transporter CorA
VIVEHCNLALFVTGEAQGGTVLSFSSDRVELLKLSTVRSPNGTSTKAPAAEDAHRGLASGSEDLEMFSRVLVQLRTSYSRLRTGDAHTFVMRTLAEVTEEYTLVTEAFDAALSILQKRLEKERDKIKEKDVKRIQKAVVQLGSMFRLVRPILSSMLVDSGLSSRYQWSNDALLYVSDVRANVQRFVEDITALKEVSKMLADRVHQYSNSKTQSVLYALTLVTTVFVPGQFISSIYGMNFQDPVTGRPGMPELLWRHGYLFFWVINIFITGLTFLYYRKQQWI